MNRKEDFEKSAIDYCEDHSHCIYFEAGAEYGYQYAIKKTIEFLKEKEFGDWIEQEATSFVEDFRKAMCNG